MKSILGIGNALTDILAVLPDDSLLGEFHLPKGSMQHVDHETGDGIWQALKPLGAKYVAGGSAANTKHTAHAHHASSAMRRLPPNDVTQTIDCSLP